MSRCDRPTRIVLAAVAGLLAAAVGHPPLAALAAIPARPRGALLLVALVAAAYGQAHVDDLRRTTLRPGAEVGRVLVTAAPNGDRAIARELAAREDVLLVAPGYRPQLGVVYAVTGRLRPIDPQVRDYYATQGVHLELRASRLVAGGRRGGVWGMVDAAHAGALRRLGASTGASPARALVAGVTLGETGGLPPDVRQQFRDSGLYHLVSELRKGHNAGTVSPCNFSAMSVSAASAAARATRSSAQAFSATKSWRGRKPRAIVSSSCRTNSTRAAATRADPCSTKRSTSARLVGRTESSSPSSTGSRGATSTQPSRSAASKSREPNSSASATSSTRP